MGQIFVNHGLYLKSAREKVNFIDENYFNFYHADGDLCLRLIKNNYEILEAPSSYIEHFTHANTKVRQSNLDMESQDWKNYVLRWDQKNSTTHASNIKKVFFDESKTYKSFPRIEIYKFYFRKMVNNIKQKIKSFIN
jgi:GT2 family glycosyltransferase